MNIPFQFVKKLWCADRPTLEMSSPIGKGLDRTDGLCQPCHVASLLAMTSWECCAKKYNYKI